LTSRRISDENVVMRVSKILQAFIVHKSKLTLTQLSEQTGLNPSTVSRIANSLVTTGFLGRDEATKSFYLGINLIQLGEYAKENYSLNRISEPHVKRLANLWKERVVVDFFDDNLCLLTVQYSNAINSGYGLASSQMQVLPHATATGKVLLAFMDKKKLDHYLNTSLYPDEKKIGGTDKTITSVAVLLNELERIRKDGYAFSAGELHDDCHTVGAPIRNMFGEVIAAISISLPIIRNYSEILPLIIDSVKITADDISHDICGIHKEPEAGN